MRPRTLLLAGLLLAASLAGLVRGQQCSGQGRAADQEVEEAGEEEEEYYGECDGGGSVRLLDRERERRAERRARAAAERAPPTAVLPACTVDIAARALRAGAGFHRELQTELQINTRKLCAEAPDGDEDSPAVLLLVVETLPPDVFVSPLTRLSEQPANTSARFGGDVAFVESFQPVDVEATAANASAQSLAILLRPSPSSNSDGAAADGLRLRYTLPLDARYQLPAEGDALQVARVELPPRPVLILAHCGKRLDAPSRAEWVRDLVLSEDCTSPAVLDQDIRGSDSNDWLLAPPCSKSAGEGGTSAPLVLEVPRGSGDHLVPVLVVLVLVLVVSSVAILRRMFTHSVHARAAEKKRN